MAYDGVTRILYGSIFDETGVDTISGLLHVAAWGLE